MIFRFFVRALAAATLFLILAGALVTSTGSGLSVPDWPTTYGYNMFTFPMHLMVGGIVYEHGHRLVASSIGFFTIVLAVWLWVRDTRTWMRWLGVAALGLVILQGVLGGLTVLMKLPPAVSVAHAGLAQIFFCTMIAIAVFTSRGWTEHRYAVDDRTLRVLSVVTVAAIFVQILLGATMHHTGAGLAIPDFPLAFGRMLPPEWTSAIALNFAHRVGALVATVLIAALVGHVFAHHRTTTALGAPAMLLVILVLMQVTLGALIVWTRRDMYVNSAHVMIGALVLATTVVIALRAHRTLFSDAAERHEQGRATIAA